MKKIRAILICVILACCLISCAEKETPKETQKETQNNTQNKDDTLELVNNKTSDYTIVYAKGDPAAENFANILKSQLSKQLKVKLKVVDNETLSTPAEHEIVIGAARECANSVIAKMEKMYDFALDVQENKLILCGKNDVSYYYLLEYLEREVFSKAVDGTLTLTAADNMVYSTSALSNINYVEYWKAKFKDPTKISTADLMVLAIRAFDASSFTDSHSKTLPYRLYLPFNYDSEKEYPVILFLHGGSTRGNDNQLQIMRPYVANMLSHEGIGIDEAIIIAPQCPADESWISLKGSGMYDENGKPINFSVDEVAEADTMGCVVELLDHVLGTYSADKNRVYVTGMSMGGYGSWDIITRHTEYFAGALIMCGRGDPSKADLLVDLPIWTVHGERDNTVPVENTRELVKAIQNAGGTKIKYDEYPDMGHDIEGYTALRRELYEWLFSQSKQNANSETGTNTQ